MCVCMCECVSPALHSMLLRDKHAPFYLKHSDHFPLVHRLIGSAAVCACAATFIAACSSDPGTVTASNVALHRKLYHCDGVLW